MVVLGIILGFGSLIFFNVSGNKETQFAATLGGIIVAYYGWTENIPILFLIGIITVIRDFYLFTFEPNCKCI